MNRSSTGVFQPIIFTTKAGRRVETRPHFASFNEIHNASKSKVLILLYHRSHKLRAATGLGVGEISKQSGVNYDYVKARVSKWVGWGYLERTISNSSPGRPIYLYRIAKRGEHFIEDILPEEWLKRYVSEIRASLGKT